MNAINKIMYTSKKLSIESDNLIKEYDHFNEYIEPLFLNKFGHKYEPSLHSMYQGEKRIFLDIHKKLMKNKLGKRENLKEYHENGKLAYEFRVVSNDDSWVRTFDHQGNQTSFRSSSGFYWVKTFDNQGNQTSCKNSSKYSWVSTFDNQGRVTSYKNSRGISWKRIYEENGNYKQINYK